jgi:hypothetical protein
LIDFRYHVVSIVAVFLALTVGLVIGSSYFSKFAYDELNNQLGNLRSQNQALHATQNQLTSQVHDRDSLIAALGPDAVKGKLTGHSVAVVVLPGADKTTGDATADLLDKAGADVSGEIVLKAALVDPDQSAKVASVSSSVAAQLGMTRSGVQASAPAGAFADIASSIVRKTMPESGGPAHATPVSDSAAALVFGAYSDGGYLEMKSSTMPAADMVVVVAPPPGPEPAADVDNGYYLGFVKALDGGKGTVLAAPTTGVVAPGLLNAAMKDAWTSKNVSTADSAELPSGRIITVFALAEELTGKTGHYGLTGTAADGPLPDLGQ